MAPCMGIPIGPLARERITWLGEGKLRDDHSLERCAGRVESFPKAFEGEKRQVLVHEEIVAQPLHRHPPLLADQPEIVGFENRLHYIVAPFHFLAVGEQREHRAILGTVNADEKLLQRLEVTRRIRLGHVFDNVDRHLLVEVVA